METIGTPVMWAAFAAEWAGQLNGRFGCATPEEAVLSHELFAAARTLGQVRPFPGRRLAILTNGGGVGAHYDQYDVFLIQGLGRRRWRVGKHCDSS